MNDKGDCRTAPASPGLLIIVWVLSQAGEDINVVVSYHFFYIFLVLARFLIFRLTPAAVTSGQVTTQFLQDNRGKSNTGTGTGKNMKKESCWRTKTIFDRKREVSNLEDEEIVYVSVAENCEV